MQTFGVTIECVHEHAQRPYGQERNQIKIGGVHMELEMKHDSIHVSILLCTKTDVAKWDNHNNWKLVISFVIRDHDNCCSHIINNEDNYYLINFTFFSFMCSVFKCGRRALELEYSPMRQSSTLDNCFGVHDRH